MCCHCLTVLSRFFFYLTLFCAHQPCLHRLHSQVSLTRHLPVDLGQWEEMMGNQRIQILPYPPHFCSEKLRTSSKLLLIHSSSSNWILSALFSHLLYTNEVRTTSHYCYSITFLNSDQNCLNCRYSICNTSFNSTNLWNQIPN